MNELQKRKNQHGNKIINQDNLLIVTSSNWTDLPKDRKRVTQMNSQPIKKAEKTLSKVESNIFTSRQMFK